MVRIYFLSVLAETNSSRRDTCYSESVATRKFKRSVLIEFSIQQYPRTALVFVQLRVRWPVTISIHVGEGKLGLFRISA